MKRLIPILLVLAGVVVLLYPVVATQFNNLKQQQFANKYDHEVAQAKASGADLEAELKRAHDYNATLTGVPILDPWLAKDSADPQSGPYRHYLTELSQFDMMARLRVPSIGVNLPVYHGTNSETIIKGVGHLYGTSLPVGGEGTHAVLTSHTGMSSATLFDHLTSVKLGDKMFVDVDGETLAYQVDQIKVVLPNQIDDLKAVPGKDLLTLFTCTPYAINTHRLLVSGHRIAYDAAADSTDNHTQPAAHSVTHLQSWMYWLIGAAIVGVIGVLVITALDARHRRRQQIVDTRPKRADPTAEDVTTPPPGQAGEPDRTELGRADQASEADLADQADQSGEPDLPQPGQPRRDQLPGEPGSD